MRRWSLLFVVLAACSNAPSTNAEEPKARRPASSTTSTTQTTSSTTSTIATGTAPVAEATSTTATVVELRYRLERRTSDVATEDFEDVVAATLTDARGWARARFRFVRDADGPYSIVLGEGPEVDALCKPYDTYGKYSCQNGPIVAINADRWRSATPKWTGDLTSYRQMLVNHEVGHLLGMRHPKPQCPRAGEPAPIMNQQSTELDGCLPNPWPLDGEIALAARHDRKLAPGFGE